MRTAKNLQSWADQCAAECDAKPGHPELLLLGGVLQIAAQVAALRELLIKQAKGTPTAPTAQPAQALRVATQRKTVPRRRRKTTLRPSRRTATS